MQNAKLAVVGALLALSLGACTGATDPSNVTSTSESAGVPQEKVGAAVGSLFGGQGQQAGLIKTIPSRLVSLMIGEARAQEVLSSCSVPDRVPADVRMSTAVKAGTYGVPGSKTDSVTLTEADGCDHKDQGGKYLGFDIADKHAMTCTRASDGVKSAVVMTDSHGVFTQDLDATSPATQIYGTFSVSTDQGAGSGVSCHISIRHTPGTASDAKGEFSAVCTDDSGNAVAQTANETCQDS